MQGVESLSKDRIKNYNIERDLLSGLYKYPEALFEFDGSLAQDDFYSEDIGKVYSVFRLLIIDKGITRLDSALILATISNLGYKFSSACNISDAVSRIISNASGIEYKTVRLLAREIKMYAVRREVFESGSRLQKKMVEQNSFGGLQEIVSVADEIYFESMNKLVVEDDMVDLGAGIGKMMHDRADHPVDHVGFSSGFKHYDKAIGHIRPDSFNFISGRGKAGKSMLGLNMAFQIAQKEKIPVFYADSELNETMMKERLMAYAAGIDIALVENGRWKNNPDTCAKVLAAIPIAEAINIKYYSIRAGNVGSMISACRRFLFKKVKRNPENPEVWNKCLFLWDYIKLDFYNDKNMGNNWWLDIAKSVVHFKDFLGKTQTAAIVLGQQNTGGVAKVDKNGKLINMDNETVVAGSDEISKSSSNVSQIRFKTPSEVQRDGSAAGNCILQTFAARQGVGGDWVQISEGVIERDYVSLQRDAHKMTFTEITTNKLLRQQQSITHALK